MICWQMGKTSCKAKTSHFKVSTPKNPLINNQAVTSIRNLTTTLAYSEILTYSWTFAPILNWTWSCSSLLSFVAQIFNLWLTLSHGSQYITNSSNLNDIVGCKVIHFINNKDQEALGYKTLWRTKKKISLLVSVSVCDGL